MTHPLKNDSANLCCVCNHIIQGKSIDKLNYLGVMKRILQKDEIWNTEILESNDEKNPSVEKNQNDENNQIDENINNLLNFNQSSLSLKLYKYLESRNKEMNYKFISPFGIEDQELLVEMNRKLGLVESDCSVCFGLFRSIFVGINIEQFQPRPTQYSMHLETNEVINGLVNLMGIKDTNEMKSRIKSFVVKFMFEKYGLKYQAEDMNFEIIAKVMSEKDAKLRNKKRKRLDDFIPSGKKAAKLASSLESLEDSQIIQNSSIQHFNSDINGNNIYNSNNSNNLNIQNQLTQSSPSRLRFEYYYKPLYITGRYLKLQRGISHSCWFIGDDRIGQFNTSVEKEIIHSMEKIFGTNNIVFCSSGREDIDVRMLGTGRPYGCRIENPRFIPDSIEPLQPMSGQGTFIEIFDTVYHKFDTTIFDRMNYTIEEKRKKYRCFVISSKKLPHDLKLNELTFPFILKQKTPLRVLHRRKEMVRDKEVHDLKIIERLNDYSFILDIETSSGTYIKEFCHGDFGRTRPSLPELIQNFDGECDIIQLDVIQLIE